MTETVRVDIDCICDRKASCPKCGLSGDFPGVQPKRAEMEPEFFCLAIGCDMPRLRELCEARG